MIKYIVKNNIAKITLNRPEKRNALHPDMVAQIKQSLTKAAADENVSCLMLQAEGNSFCAGADLAYLNELKNYSPLENENDSASLAQMFLQLYRFPKPTIAAVNGAAIAGGCGLASVCDIIIADESNSKFGYSEVKIGFMPAIVSIFLIKKIGEGRAKELLLTGEIINAAKAYQYGLVNFISSDVTADAEALAEKLKSNSPYSMISTKNMIETVSNLAVDEAVDYCIRLNAISRSSKEFAAGLNKFLTKQKRL